MKYFLATLIFTTAFFLSHATAKAEGHLILSPYNNSSQKEDGMGVGLALKEKLVGPLFFEHATVLGMKRTEGMHSTMNAFESRTALGLKAFDWFYLSGGYMAEKVRKQDETDHITYMSLDAKLW